MLLKRLIPVSAIFLLLGVGFFGAYLQVTAATSDSVCQAPTATLARGDTDQGTGGQVTVLQKFISQHYKVAPDTMASGFFGSKTKDYVVRFQAENGLDPIGVVGARTIEKMASTCVLQNALTALPKKVSPAPTVAVSTDTATTELMIGGLYNAYSPALLDHKGVKKMWIGGWAKEADIGSDIIYYSEIIGGKATTPVKSFSFPGHLANDPSVIINPSNASELLMFFTALKEEYATAAEMTKRNWVAMAKSTDGGKSWKSPEIVIGQDNTYDERGAWSPSAVVVRNEIWLYYNANDGSPDIYRTRLNSKTFDIIATEPVTMSGQRLAGINVEVKKIGGRYVMLLTTSLTEMMRYVSVDGLMWRTDTIKNPVLVAARGSSIVTPTLVVEGGKEGIYFAGGPIRADGNYRYSSINRVPDITSGKVIYTSKDDRVAKLPDYVITKVDPILSGEGGRNTIRSFSVTIKNQGGDIDNSKAVAVQAFGRGGLPVFQTSTLPIDAGLSRTVVLTNTNADFVFSEGDFTYDVRVDTTSAVTELAEENNEYVATGVIGPDSGGTLAIKTCVPGRGKSANAPNNEVVCDARASWSATGDAYVLIRGAFPYDENNYPHGFLLSPAKSAQDQVFWVTTGTFTATLYEGGVPPTQTTAGTGREVKRTSFTIGAASNKKVSPPAVVYPYQVPNKTSDWTREGALLKNFLNMYNGHVLIEEGAEYPYKMWFFGWATHTCNNPSWPSGPRSCDAIFFARSTDGNSWQVYSGKDSAGRDLFDRTENPSLWKPVLTAQNLYYDEVHVGDPSVVKVGSIYYMVYSASGNDLDGIGNGQPGDRDGDFNGIMGAVSSDGISWQRAARPFFAAENERGGVDTAPGNMYSRPTLMYENRTFKMWFDYWVSNDRGTSMGYAEMKVPATREGFLRGSWEVIRGGDNPAIINWPNPDVVKVGNNYVAFGDPLVDLDGNTWMSKKITEATSRDGLNWNIVGYIDPDTGCAAAHTAEAYVADGKLNVTYGCQKGGSPYDEHYKEIRRIHHTLTSSPPSPTPCRGGLGCVPTTTPTYSLAVPTTIAQGQPLTVSWAPAGGTGHWIGLYRTGAADTSYVDYKYTDKKTTETFPTTTLTPGTYEFRYFLDLGYSKRNTVSRVVTVTPRSVTPTTTPTTCTTGRLNPGQTLTPGRSITSCNGAHTATFGTDGNFTFGAWNSRTAGQSATRLVMQNDGNLVVYAGSRALWSLLSHDGGRMGTGQYLELRNDGTLAVYNQKGEVRWDSRMMLKKSNPVATSTTITVPTNITQGQPLTVSWTPTGRVGHWIGLYRKGASNTSYTDFKYTANKTTETFTTSARTPGEYEFRYFLDGGYTALSGVSRGFNITAVTPTPPTPCGNGLGCAPIPTTPTVTGTITTPTPCVVGVGKSTSDPKNAVICDQTINWSTTNNPTNVRLVITGAFPYDTANFASGYAAGTGPQGPAVPFWVTAGTYRATLFSGTTKLDEKTFTIAPAVLAPATPATTTSQKSSLNQMASVLEALRSLLGGWR